MALIDRILRGFAPLLGLVLVLMAGPTAAADEMPDPPARVGRIGLISGTVETWTPADNTWIAAGLNTPVTSGLALWADSDARAEVRIGSAAVRLASNTQANFSRVDDDLVSIESARGSVRVRVRNIGENDRFLLSAGGIQIEVLQPGDFRLDNNPDRRRAVLRVFSGRAQILGIGEQIQLGGGQQAELDTDNPRLVSLGEATRNAFDAWAEARDREQDRLASARYVSPEMTGIEALDEHGRWNDEPDYGPVWYPRVVVAGWAPYRYGRWVWVAPWGYTWIDDAPWGFAPFHYGRWVEVRGRWGWLPGARIARPVYAPALVGFYGGGPRLGVSIGVGAVDIGWFPLGPAEVYRPVYRSSPDYIRRVNITHVTNITVINKGPRHDDHYRYAHRPDAATFVPRGVFAGARPIGPAALPVDPQRIGRLPVGVRPDLPPRPAPVAPVARPTGPVRLGPSGEVRPVLQNPPPAGPRAGEPDPRWRDEDHRRHDERSGDGRNAAGGNRPGVPQPDPRLPQNAGADRNPAVNPPAPPGAERGGPSPVRRPDRAVDPYAMRPPGATVDPRTPVREAPQRPEPPMQVNRTPQPGAQPAPPAAPAVPAPIAEPRQWRGGERRGGEPGQRISGPNPGVAAPPAPVLRAPQGVAPPAERPRIEAPRPAAPAEPRAIPREREGAERHGRGDEPRGGNRRLPE